MKESDKKIERYVNGLLTEIELIQFEAELEHNPDLAMKVAMEKDLLSGIESIGNLDLKAQLQRIHQETIISKDIITAKPRIVSRRKWLAIAAALIGVIGTVWYFSSQKEVTSSTLYATYAKHDFDFQEKNNDNFLLANVENLLKNEEYEKAMPLLNEYLNKNPDDAQILLAKGIALIEIGKDADSALVIFRRLQKDFPVYRDEGYWYEGLLFLKRREVDKAKFALEQISANSQRNQTKDELLLKIRNL